MKPFLFFFFIIVSLYCPGSLHAVEEPASDIITETTPDKVRADTMQAIFSGHESLHFEVSWCGGVKIGDLYMMVNSVDDTTFGIVTRIHDYGIFKLIYPVNDFFVTWVNGEMKLPYQFEGVQREGILSKEVRVQYLYDQEKYEVSYQKNDEPFKIFSNKGKIYNEFAAFYITRALNFKQAGNEIIVPAYADGKRNEVVVSMLKRERLEDTVLGEVDTIKIQPTMSFNGLYNKNGKVLIWVTDDVCRIPITIKSDLLIGSLRADLVEYSNPGCPDFRYRKVVGEAQK